MLGQTSLVAATNTANGAARMIRRHGAVFPVFSGVGAARQFSPALRSSNRYYLNQTGDNSIQQKIFSVAKYEVNSGSPATTDIVFAFANLDRNNDQSGNFNLNITGTSGNLLELKDL